MTHLDDDGDLTTRISLGDLFEIDSRSDEIPYERVER
jgi:hypothetical protein